MNSVTITVDDIRDVLAKAIALEAGVTVDQIVSDEPFTSLGIDSMAALSVGMEIEDVWGLKDLPVNLMWDYPTLDTLADALLSLINPDLVQDAEEME